MAMENNLFGSVELIIDYIVKHQNNFVYSNLFKDNIINMLYRGVKIETLVKKSNVLQFEFEYD